MISFERFFQENVCQKDIGKMVHCHSWPEKGTLQTCFTERKDCEEDVGQKMVHRRNNFLRACFSVGCLGFGAFGTMFSTSNLHVPVSFGDGQNPGLVDIVYIIIYSS